MRILLSVSLLLATLLTPAFAALPQQAFIALKPLDINNLDSIKSIGLLEVPSLGSYALRRGDIGLEIFVGDYSNDILRPIEYDKSTKEYRGYNFSAIAGASLTKELQLENYKVLQFSADRNNKNRFLDSYQSLSAQGVDAYLDVVPQLIGYYRADRQIINGIIYDSPPFYLYVSIIVQLVSADSSQLLYRDRVTYRSSTTDSSGKTKSTSGTVVYSPDDHQFENPRDLKENAEIALEQIAQKIEMVMQEIARKISKNQ